MSIQRIVLFGVILLVAMQEGLGQGFVNLNFENATFITDPSIPYRYPPPYAVYASNAIPGWTAYVNGVKQMDIASNAISLSGESISIIGTNNMFGSPAIQGRYYMFLASANYPGTGLPISIGQIGTIPTGAASIEFWGTIGGMQATFDGHPLVFAIVGSTASYSIYAADISPYAGQTGDLIFAVPPYVGSAAIDNIQFSTNPVPEPSILSMLSVCFIFIILARSGLTQRWSEPPINPGICE